MSYILGLAILGLAVFGAYALFGFVGVLVLLVLGLITESLYI